MLWWILSAVEGILLGSFYYLLSRYRISLTFNIFFGLLGSILGMWFSFVVWKSDSYNSSGNFWSLILWSFVGAVTVLAIVGIFINMALKLDYERVRFSKQVVAHNYNPMKRVRRKYKKKIVK